MAVSWPLVSAYVAAFADTVEYCDVPEEAIARSAGENIRAFLGGDRGPALPSSCVATYSGTAGPGVGAVAGAALVTRARNGAPLLDMLFVTPAWQRRGLATALVAWSLQELLARGKVEPARGCRRDSVRLICRCTGISSAWFADQVVLRSAAAYRIWRPSSKS